MIKIKIKTASMLIIGDVTSRYSLPPPRRSSQPSVDLLDPLGASSALRASVQDDSRFHGCRRSLSAFPPTRALDRQWRWIAFAEADALLRHGGFGDHGAKLVHLADPRIGRLELLDGGIDAGAHG